MSLRRLLLRIMLAALAATAFAGAWAVLTGSGTLGFRVFLTMLSAAGAAAVMIPFSIFADKPRLRRVGLVGLCVVVGQFAASLGLIWGVFDLFGGGLSERVGLTMLSVAIVLFPLLLMLWQASYPAGRIAGWTGAAIVLAAFVCLLIPNWSAGGWWRNENWLVTAALVGGLGLLGVTSLVGVGAKPSRHWRWIGVLCAAVALTAAIYSVWTQPPQGAALFAIIVSVAAVIGHANLCLFVPLIGWQRAIRGLTIAAATFTAAMIDLSIFFDGDGAGAAVLFGAASGIIASCGSLALIIMAALNRRVDRPPALTNIRSLCVICPNCQLRQDVPVGGSECANCRLKFAIEITEPRCEKCDYLLLMNTSDHCPECGHAVAQVPVPSPSGRGLG